jgi:hypothetical protein
VACARSLSADAPASPRTSAGRAQRWGCSLCSTRRGSQARHSSPATAGAEYAGHDCRGTQCPRAHNTRSRAILDRPQRFSRSARWIASSKAPRAQLSTPTSMGCTRRTTREAVSERREPRRPPLGRKPSGFLIHPSRCRTFSLCRDHPPLALASGDQRHRAKQWPLSVYPPRVGGHPPPTGGRIRVRAGQPV